MKPVDRSRIEKLLQNIDPGFIPKDLIISANVTMRNGDTLTLTPDEYEDLILREADSYRSDPYAESDIIGMKMMLDLEKINELLNMYTTELYSLFD